MSSKGSVYSKICGSPIYDTFVEGSMDLDTWENISIEEEHLEFSRNHSESYHAEPHKCISNEDIEKQCCEKLDVMQSMEYKSQPYYSHVEVPYDLEHLGAYAMSYHSIRPDDGCDDVVSLPHHQIHNLSILLIVFLINGVKKQVPQVSYKTAAGDLI